MSIHQKTIFRLTRFCLVMVSASLIFLLRPQQTFGQVVEVDQVQNVTTGNHRNVAYVAGTDQPVDVSISGGQALTYRLGNGNDESLFDVSASTGLVRFKSAPDFDKPTDANGDNVYVVDVIAEEKGKKTTVTTHITVAAPTFTSTEITSINDSDFYSYQITTTDGDGDDVSITATTIPSWLSLVSRIDQTSVVTTLAGVGSNVGFLDGTGTTAQFNAPMGMDIDAAGNIYVADQINNRIRKITPEGVVTTFAGSGTYGDSDGTGTEASFGRPQDVAVDASGNVYVADTGYHGIRKITPAGVVTQFAGAYDEDPFDNRGFRNGQGTNAEFDSPVAIDIDSNGVLYVVDQTNNAIRKISATGYVITLAGSGSYNDGSADGFGNQATFNYPADLAIDAENNVYVADGFRLIRKIDTNGETTTVVPSSGSPFSNIGRITFDTAGNLLVTDQSRYRVYKRSRQGVVTTVSGSGTRGYVDAAGSSARYTKPNGIAVDTNGSVFVADAGGHTIRKITASQAELYGDPANQIGTHNVVLTADDGNAGLTDQTFTITVNNGIAPVFTSLTTVGFREGETGTAYLAAATDASPLTYSLGTAQDEAHFDIVAATGEVTFKAAPDFETPGDGDTDNIYALEVIASDPSLSTSLNVNIIVTDLSEAAPVFTSTPTTTFDDNGGLLFDYDITTTHADENAIAIAATTLPDWLTLGQTIQVTTLAGAGSGFINGTGTIAKFARPLGMDVDASGNIYVADQSNNRIRKITAAGVVSTFAGADRGSANGTGTDATFYNPSDVAIDAAGNLYVADLGNRLIRKITPAGVTTTYAGIRNPFSRYSDGPAASAQFDNPKSLVVDAVGFVYVVEDNKIRKISPDGIVSTLAGSPAENLSADGTGMGARFNRLQGITIDKEGNLYVSDGDYSTQQIRKITPEGVVTTLRNQNNSIISFSSVTDLKMDVGGNLLVVESRHRIRQISPEGVVSVLAGSTSSGNVDGSGDVARFNSPSHLAIGLNGDVFVSEISNYSIRKIQRPYTLKGDPFGRAGAHPVVLSADDGDNNVTLQSFTINILDKQADPIITSTPVIAIDDDQTYVYDLTATDQDREDVTFTGTTIPAWLSVVEVTPGNFRLTGDPVGEGGVHSIVLTADDGNVGTVQQTFDITVTDVTPPAFSSPTTAIFAENATGTVYTAAAADGKPFAFSLGTSNDESGLSIVPSTGVLTFDTPPDFENPADGNNDNVYRVEVIATDNSNNASSHFVNVSVSNESDSNPIFTSTALTSINEDQVYSYQVTGTDSDVEIVSFTASTLPAWLTLDVTGSGASAIYTLTGDPLGQSGSFNVVLDASDGNTGTATQSFTVTVVDNINPVTTSVASLTVQENATGTVYTATATDTNPITYSLDTDKDAALFNITGVAGELTFLSTPDFEAPADQGGNNIYDVDVLVADATGNTSTIPLQIIISNVSDIDPVFDSSPVTTADNNADYSYEAEVSDQDNDFVTVSATTAPAWLNVNAVLTVETLAGSGASGLRKFNDSQNQATAEHRLDRMVVGPAGNTFIIESKNNEIRKISKTGVVTVFADDFSDPTAIAVDEVGSLYVADIGRGGIYKVTRDGITTVLASISNTPVGGIAIDNTGNIYFSYAILHTIWKIAPGDAPMLFAGTNGVAGDDDDLGTDARFNSPHGLAADASGNVYVADYGNSTIRQMASDGTITTLAGFNFGSTDGMGMNAEFAGPTSVSIDENGDLLVADAKNHSIRKVTTAGQVTTLMGGAMGFTNGPAMEAKFNYPTGVAEAPNGDLVVLDQDNNSVRRVYFSQVLSGDATGKAGTYNILLTADDGQGGTADQSFTLTVADVTAPIFTSEAQVSFNENGTGTAYTAAATDEATIMYSLGTSRDESLFNIAGGLITFIAAPDFESPGDGDTNNAYEIEVIADDGTNQSSLVVTVSVTNVDDTDPVFTSAASVSFEENGTGIAHTVVATDANQLSFRLGNSNDEGQFGLINSTGGTAALLFNSPPDFEDPKDGDTNNTYLVEVIATDGINEASQLVTITVTDVNEASFSPIMITLILNYAENGTGEVYNASASSSSLIFYSLGTANDESLFNLVGGSLSFINSPDFETPLDADGNNEYKVQMTITDGTSSVNIMLVITVTDELDAISAPIITGITDDTGSSNSDGITNDSNIIISGTAEPLASVEVFTQYGPVRTTQADANGDWALDITDISLMEMTFSLTAVATNLGGDSSPASNAFVLIADYTAPAKPVINSITDDTGSSNSDGVTNDANIIISGRAEALSSVEVFTQFGPVRTTQTDANGDWALDITDISLMEMSFNLTAKATDLAGNSSAASDIFALTADYTAPVKPVITGITDDTGSSNSDGITNDANIIISGTAEALSSVEVFTQFASVRTTQADANGDWALDITDITLVELSFNLTAEATDLAGNTSAASDVFVLIADRTAPAKPVITSITDDTGSSNSDGVTNDNNIIISGTAEALSSVEVFTQFSSVRTTQTDANGDWSLDITDISLLELSFNLTAKATDLAGNTSAASDIFALKADYTDATVVLTAPSAPTASGYIVTAQFNEDVSGFTLSDITVATGTASNLQTVNASTFTFTVTSGNPAADVSIAVGLVSDLAGNPNTASNNLNLDFTIPPAIGALQNSLVEFVKSEEVNLYPNPVSNVLTIDLSEISAKEVDILMINTSGIAVFDKSRFTGKTLRLDVSGYTNGLYIVQLNDGSRIIRKKVMVKK